MDDRRRAAPASRRPGAVQNSAYRSRSLAVRVVWGGRRAGRCDRRSTSSSVLVGSEDVGRRAGVADRGRRLEVAEGERSAPIRIEALDDVEALAGPAEVADPPERAAPDPLRREGLRQRVGRVGGEREGHGPSLGSSATSTGGLSDHSGEPSTSAWGRARREWCRSPADGTRGPASATRSRMGPGSGPRLGGARRTSEADAVPPSRPSVRPIVGPPRCARERRLDEGPVAQASATRVGAPRAAMGDRGKAPHRQSDVRWSVHSCG